VSKIVALREAEKLRVVSSLWGVSTAADAAVGIGFFEVGVVSLVLCRLLLRTSLKPSSCVAADFGVLDWPAGGLASSMAFNSCRVTVYVPYRALNRGFPVRALRKFCLFPSAALTMDDHCSLSPTGAGFYPGTPRCRRIFKQLFQLCIGVVNLSY
jgi:hypothetical protein